MDNQNLRAFGLPPKKIPKRPCKIKQWHKMQYHWTCYQSPWKDVELVTIRWFPSHHILHPANIFENYQSMSSLPHFCRKKSTPTQQRSVLLAMPSNPQTPPPSPFPKKEAQLSPTNPLPNHSHHQHQGTFAFQQFVLQIRRSIIRFDHLFGTLPQPWVWCTGDQCKIWQRVGKREGIDIK